MDLTIKETEVMKAIEKIATPSFDDEWGMIADIYMLEYNHKTVIRTIGSLAKKALVVCDIDEGIHWVKFTDEGKETLHQTMD